MRRPFALALSAALLTLGACGSTKRTTSTVAPYEPHAVHLAGSLRLTSSAFRPNGAIPRLYTCNGRNTSLPLSWTGVPAGTKELVLVMRDPDAPSGNFVHWALAGIRPMPGMFSAGGVSGLVVPGRNSFGSLGYRGPCPPPGRAHHYVLTLTALPARSGLRPGFDPEQLRVGALAIATLIGTYGR